MKKFIFLLLSFLAPLILLGVIIEFGLRQIPNDYGYKKTFLDEYANEIQTLFLGNSHTFYGIDPTYITGIAFNSSHVSQSINYDYEILNKYSNEWESLHSIIIPIDYFTFFSRTETGIEAWRAKNYTIYYGFDAFKSTDYSEFFSLSLGKNLRRLDSYYILGKPSTSCTKLGFGNSDIKQGDLIKTGIVASRRHTRSNNRHYEENLETLETIIKFASDRAIQVILYTSPAYKTYVSNLELKQLNLTLKTARELSEKYINCSYINLLEDSSFESNDFRDADHLNLNGARKLSIKMDSILHLQNRLKSIKLK